MPNLPASKSFFWIVWSWILSHASWESHLPKMCFPVCVNTGGSLFRHALFKICREGLSFFSPMGFLKHSWNTCEVLQNCHNPILWEDTHFLFFWIFYLNNRITLEGELSIFLDPLSRIFNSCQPPWQGNRRRVKSLVSLLTWKMMKCFSLFSYSVFFLLCL